MINNNFLLSIFFVGCFVGSSQAMDNVQTLESKSLECVIIGGSWNGDISGYPLRKEYPVDSGKNIYDHLKQRYRIIPVIAFIKWLNPDYYFFQELVDLPGDVNSFKKIKDSFAKSYNFSAETETEEKEQAVKEEDFKSARLKRYGGRQYLLSMFKKSEFDQPSKTKGIDLDDIISEKNLDFLFSLQGKKGKMIFSRKDESDCKDISNYKSKLKNRVSDISNFGVVLCNRVKHKASNKEIVFVNFHYHPSKVARFVSALVMGKVLKKFDVKESDIVILGGDANRFPGLFGVEQTELIIASCGKEGFEMVDATKGAKNFLKRNKNAAFIEGEDADNSFDAYGYDVPRIPDWAYVNNNRIKGLIKGLIDAKYNSKRDDIVQLGRCLIFNGKTADIVKLHKEKFKNDKVLDLDNIDPKLLNEQCSDHKPMVARFAIMVAKKFSD